MCASTIFPQQVQEAVARCLPPLVPAVKEEAGALIEQLMKQLLEGEKYAERKGAAYGLAGVVKGMGILSLKQFNIVNELTVCVPGVGLPGQALFLFSDVHTVGRGARCYHSLFGLHCPLVWMDHALHSQELMQATYLSMVISTLLRVLICPTNPHPQPQEAIQDKAKPKYREGALMAFETLIGALGRLFEPYVIRLLPFLLVCFGDGNKDVREAAEDAAKAIVKFVEPPPPRVCVFFVDPPCSRFFTFANFVDA